LRFVIAESAHPPGGRPSAGSRCPGVVAPGWRRAAGLRRASWSPSRRIRRAGRPSAGSSGSADSARSTRR